MGLGKFNPVKRVKQVVSSVNSARKDVVKAVVPSPVYNAVSDTAQKIGSSINDARKDVTKSTLTGFSDIMGLLGPVGVPLATAALTATGVGAPFAAALAAAANTAGKSLDAGRGLNDSFRSGALSGALSGGAAYGGGLLGSAINPAISGQFGQTAARYATPAITSGLLQGGFGALTGQGSFGQNFQQGALGSLFSRGFNDATNSAANGIASAFGQGANKFNFSNDVTDPLLGAVKSGLGFGQSGGQSGFRLTRPTPVAQQPQGQFDFGSLYSQSQPSPQMGQGGGFQQSGQFNPFQSFGQQQQYGGNYYNYGETGPGNFQFYRQGLIG